VEHPTLEKEVRIIRGKVPGVSERLAEEIGRFMQSLRRRPLRKVPGVAETIDWAEALVRLHRDRLDPETVADTVGCFLKDDHDTREIRGEGLGALVASARTGG
jgi:MoxR-like ATPase